MTERQRQRPAAAAAADSLLPVVVSVGIFVGTALLSQWVQQQKQQQRQQRTSSPLSYKRRRDRRRHSRPSPSPGHQSRGLQPPSAAIGAGVAPREWRGHWSRNVNVFGDEDEEEDDEYDYESEDLQSEIQQHRLYMHHLQQQQQRTSMENEQEDDEYWRCSARENYMRRRLEDRLSFHGEDEEDEDEDEDEEQEGVPTSAPLSTATTETEDDCSNYKNNARRSPMGIPESFMPKNSNWNHFERCHGEITRDSHHRVSSTASLSVASTTRTRIQRDVLEQQQQLIVDGSVAEQQHNVLRQSDSDEYSLEGEHAKSNHHGSSNRRDDNNDEDYDGSSSDDDSDVSLTSQLHFVWTEAHYHDKRRHQSRQQQQYSQQQPQQRLPVIHSQRDFRLEDLHLETDNRDEMTTDAAALSSPRAAALETGVALSSSFSSNSSNATNSAATSRTPSPQPTPRPQSYSSTKMKRCGQELRRSLSMEGRLTDSSSHRVQSRTATSDAAVRGAATGRATALPAPPPAAAAFGSKTRAKTIGSKSSPKQCRKQRCLSEPVFQQSKSRVRRMKQRSKPRPSSVSSTCNPHREARANYNARIMPDKLILVRHGQSLGNTDEKVYSTTPDNLVPLTDLGWEQARAAGRRLRHQILKKSSSPTASTKSPPPTQVHFIVSPYVRTVETFHGIVSAWCDPSEFDHISNRDARIKAWYSRLVEMGISWAEDPRIREQDFGNLQDPVKIKHSKQERHNFGAFYYRFGAGESAADVFDRMSTFLDSLWRSFDMNQSQYFVLVTHGISIRVLLSRYFRYTIDQFHLLSNPRNCEMVELEHDGKGRLRMAGRHELECQVLDRSRGRNENDEAQVHVPEETSRPQQRHQQQRRILRYRYHERLRVLPPEFVRTTHIRISHDDC